MVLILCFGGRERLGPKHMALFVCSSSHVEQDFALPKPLLGRGEEALLMGLSGCVVCGVHVFFLFYVWILKSMYEGTMIVLKDTKIIISTRLIRHDQWARS